MVGGVIGVTKRVSIKQWSVTRGGDWLLVDTLGWTRLRGVVDTTLMTEFTLRSVDKLWRHNYLSASSVNVSAAVIRWSSTVRIMSYCYCLRARAERILFLLSPPRRLCFTRCLFVCLSVCLSVCLLATSRKDYWLDLRENYIRDVGYAYLWKGKTG